METTRRFNRHGPISGGMLVMPEGGSSAATLGCVLLDATHKERRFLVTAAHLVESLTEIPILRMFHPVAPAWAASLGAPDIARQVCDWWTPDLQDRNGPVRQPNLLAGAARDDFQDVLAIELDPRVKASVASVVTIGSVSAPAGRLVAGTAVCVRGATGPTRRGVVRDVSVDVAFDDGRVGRGYIAVAWDGDQPRGSLPGYWFSTDNGALVFTMSGPVYRAVGVLSCVDGRTGLALVSPIERLLECGLRFP